MDLSREYEIDESISVIGNGTSNTTINGTWLNSNVILVSNADVTIKNLKIVSGSNSSLYPLIKISGNDAVLNNLDVSGGSVGMSVAGSGVTILNSKATGHSSTGIRVISTSTNSIIHNSIVSNSDSGIYIILGAGNVLVHNNSIHNNTNGIKSEGYGSIIRDNNIVDNSQSGISLDGRTNDDPDNIVRNNTVLRNNDGIYLGNQDAVLYSNAVKNNDRFGVVVDDSTGIYLWNNTITNNDDIDLEVKDSSTDNYAIGTIFNTVSVDSTSILIVKSYINLNVTDARGLNISGIDLRIKEGDSVKYSTDYFGGSDSKTDANGTIATFLVDSKKYDGSSTPTVVPTSVSARSNDWVETNIFDPSETINITVPDLRVINTRTEVLTYNIQTAIDDAEEGDTIHAWNGTYYENIEISDEVTLKGNGTSTIINGTSGTAIEINDNDIVVEDLLIISSEKGIFINGAHDVSISTIRFTGNEYAVYVEDSQRALIDNSEFDLEDYGIYFTGSSSSATVEYNKFRNATESAIYQSESDENGASSIHHNTFNDCGVGWQSEVVVTHSVTILWKITVMALD